MKSKIRIAAWLLAIATLIPLSAASCGGNGDDSKTTDSKRYTTTAGTVDTEEPKDALEARKDVDDELGEYDFKEYEYRIYTTDGNGVNWIQEADAKDVVDVAVYERNLAVAERFNCKFSVMDRSYGNVGTYIPRMVNSGEDAFDLASSQCIITGSVALSDVFLNWYDIPNIDFSKPWWSDSNVEDLTHNGVCILAVGDAALSALASTYCVFYNKALGARYDLPDMYEIVRDGDWTFDKAVELSRDIYDDTNLNGEKDNEDIYGYTSDPQSNINTYLWAFDNPVFEKNGDSLEFVYKTDKVPAIIQVLMDTFNVYDGMRSDLQYISPVTQSSHWYSMEMFGKGLSVFANGFIGTALSSYRDMEDDYAILPYPKWDENQEEYYTMADGGHEIMAIPLTAQELERVGTITEALCAESYKTLVPAYYDKALKAKGTRDMESIELLDMLVDARVFDFGYVYDGWAGASFLMQNMFTSRNSNFESLWKSQEARVTKHYNEVIEYFENYSH